MECHSCRSEIKFSEQLAQLCKICHLDVCHDCYQHLKLKLTRCQNCDSLLDSFNSDFENPLMKLLNLRPLHPHGSVDFTAPNSTRRATIRNVKAQSTPENYSCGNNERLICQADLLFKQLQGDDSQERLKHLSSLRVIQNNLIYVIGIPPELAHEGILARYGYFGQYGKIIKIAIKQQRIYSNCNSMGSSYSVYITYRDPIEAAVAIMCVDNCRISGRTLHASLGTTKYCVNFLKGIKCHNLECQYLHFQNESQSVFTKEDDEIDNKVLFANLKRVAAQILQRAGDSIMIRKVNNPALPPSSCVWDKLRRYFSHEQDPIPPLSKRSSFDGPAGKTNESIGNYDGSPVNLSICSFATSSTTTSHFEENEKSIGKLLPSGLGIDELALSGSSVASDEEIDGNNSKHSATNPFQQEVLSPLSLLQVPSITTKMSRLPSNPSSTISSKTSCDDLDKKIYNDLISSQHKSTSRFDFAQGNQTQNFEELIDFNELIHTPEVSNHSGKDQATLFKSSKRLFEDSSPTIKETSGKEFQQSFPVQEASETTGFQAIMGYLESSILKKNSGGEPVKRASVNSGVISLKPCSLNPKVENGHFGRISNPMKSIIRINQ